MRISNCSRASLFTNVDRLTVTRSIFVGRGMGPVTSDPARSAVSIIVFADSSTIL